MRWKCDVRVGRERDFINKDNGGAANTLCLPEVKPSHPARCPKVFPALGSEREKRGCAVGAFSSGAREVARSLVPWENSVADCSVYFVSSSTPMNKQSVVYPVGAENTAFLSGRASRFGKHEMKSEKIPQDINLRRCCRVFRYYRNELIRGY